MKLIDMSCPHCGAHLQIDTEKPQAFCSHCGAKLLIDDEVEHVQFDNAEQAGYEFEKGRQRAQAEVRPNQSQGSSNQQSEAYQKGKNTALILWILGWILIFPLPLTILLMRKKGMGLITRTIIIIVAWSVWLAIITPKGCSSSSKKTSETTAVEKQEETTPAGTEQTKESTDTETEAEEDEYAMLDRFIGKFNSASEYQITNTRKSHKSHRLPAFDGAPVVKGMIGDSDTIEIMNYNRNGILETGFRVECVCESSEEAKAILETTVKILDPSVTDQKIWEDLYQFETSDGRISSILYGDTNRIDVMLDGGSLFVDVDLYEECK